MRTTQKASKMVKDLHLSEGSPVAAGQEPRGVIRVTPFLGCVITVLLGELFF